MDVIAAMAARFNHDNQKYYVELRTCHYGEELATLKDWEKRHVISQDRFFQDPGGVKAASGGWNKGL